LLRRAIPKPRYHVFRPPGTISFVGEDRTKALTAENILYNETHFSKQDGIFRDLLIEDRVNCFNIDGVHDIDLLEKAVSKFHLHHLLLEDIANTTQRPKKEF
jgi:magnesium transporter